MPTRSLLLVCAANRCRSPLAAALLQRMLMQEAPIADAGQDSSRDENNHIPAWRVESAGLYARPGERATTLAQAAARLAGLDLSSHRSRPIEAVTLEEFDLILTMEEVQADALIATYPSHKARILQLSQLVNLKVDIEDPTGFGPTAHQATLDLLERYLRAGMPNLLKRITSPSSTHPST